MKSPFPGMDPYIVACGLWEGFHNHLVHRIDEAIAQILPRGYTVDVAVRRYLVLTGAEDKDEHLPQPDVTVTQSAGGKKPRKKKGGAAVDAEEAESVPMRA